MLLDISNKFRYIKLKKGIARRFIDMKGKVSLYYNQITIGLQLVTSSFTSWKHTVQAVPSKKKGKKK